MDQVICPRCSRTLRLDSAAITARDEGRGRTVELECPDGHVFLLHDGLMATKLQPDHYHIFWPIQGVECGELRLRVGEWTVVPLTRPFDQIDRIKTYCLAEEKGRSLLNARSEAQCDNTNPSHFWLLTSGAEQEWGQKLVVKWTAYGTVASPSPPSEPVWKENLVFAARQFLANNYRPCVIQSAVAVESYVYDLVIGHLKLSGWSPNTIDEYVSGQSRDSLSLQGVIKVCIEEVMGRQIQPDTWAEWRTLKKMRDALAHGDLMAFRKLRQSSGQPFAREHDRAKFSYQAAVRFIYGLRYPAEAV